MTARLIYLTHPEVRIDAGVAVPDWPLSDRGRARLSGVAARPWLGAVTSVWTSTEAKSCETGALLAAELELEPRARAGLDENDRSATGYLPPEAFEDAADAFFAHPDTSFRGWETARAAQARCAAAVTAILAKAPPGDVLICGHGAVGTLLWCRLAGRAIDRMHDQKPGGGCVWSAPRAGGAPAGGWRRMEEA